MKRTWCRYVFGLCMMALLCFLLPTVQSFAGTTITVNMTVGETKYLYVEDGSHAATSAAWSSSNQDAVVIKSQDSVCCKVEAVGATSKTPVIVQCRFQYVEYKNGFPRLFTDYTDYRITVSEKTSGNTTGNNFGSVSNNNSNNSTSSSSKCELYVKTTTLQLDLANYPTYELDVLIQGTVPASWEIVRKAVGDGYVDMNRRIR